MIVLDARVLIAYLDADNALHADAEAVLADTADEEWIANTITLAEVLVGPARAGDTQPTLAALHDLEVNESPFPAGAAPALARLQAETGLKLPDCCVLLAAEEARATVATFDGRLRRAAAQHGLQVWPAG